MRNLSPISGLSPVQVSSAKPTFTLAADMTLKINGHWCGIEPEPRAFVYDNVPQHRDSGSWPGGGNHVFIDGLGKFVKFRQMFALHIWNWAQREAYFYRDPSPFPAGFAPQLAQP